MIAARDEAGNIRACIRSVGWAREVLVVEDGSIDDTAAIAGAAGAIVVQNPFVTIGGQRNAGIARAASSWILVIDADERGTSDLADAVTTAISSESYAAYRIPRRNFFLGREIKHGGWERDRPMRLFRSSIRYNESRVHERIEVAGEVGVLPASLMHEPYASLDRWFAKLGPYSRWWAQDRYEKGRRCSIASVVFRPPARFVTMFILRGGFMDGARGALLASMAAMSVAAKYAQLWALSNNRAAQSRA